MTYLIGFHSSSIDKVSWILFPFFANNKLVLSDPILVALAFQSYIEDIKVTRTMHC